MDPSKNASCTNKRVVQSYARLPVSDVDELLVGVGSRFQSSDSTSKPHGSSSFKPLPKYAQVVQIPGASLPDLNKASAEGQAMVSKPQRSNSSPAALSTQSIDPASSLNIRLWLQGTDEYCAGYSRQDKISNK